jgi:flagellar hook-length control protein FliK
VRIEVTLEAGRLKVDMWADQEDARRLLKDNRQALQDELARHQMHMDQFNVGGEGERQAGDSRYRPPVDQDPARPRGGGRPAPVAAPTARVSTHDGQIDTLA